MDSASSVQDAEIVQKPEDHEQGGWRAEWEAYYCKPGDLQISETSNSVSVPDAEVERLKEKIANLEYAQAAIEEERDEWQAKCRRKSEATVRLSDAIISQDQKIRSLEYELFDLHDKLTARIEKLSSLEAQVKTFSEFQLRQRKEYEETVAQLRSQLDEKDRDNASIQADLWMLTKDLRNGQTKDEDIIEDDLTATLERKNTQFTKLHDGAGVGSSSELEDVKEALAIAEAELEAFYATLPLNKQLKTQYDAILAQNIELMQTKNEFLHKIKHTEQSLAIYRTKSEQAIDRVGELAEELELLKPDNSSNTGEMSHETGTFFISLSASEYSQDPPEPRQTPKLTYSPVQVLSTKPRTPDNPFVDPEFHRHLPTHEQRPNCQPQLFSPPLHAHLTITIQPSTSSWTLLQRAGSVLSRRPSSSLAINGPPSLVTRFVDEMQRLETHHGEQTKLAVQWERVAGTHIEEARGLREELDKKGCGVPEHRGLLDELEARKERCEM